MLLRVNFLELYIAQKDCVFEGPPEMNKYCSALTVRGTTAPNELRILGSVFCCSVIKCFIVEAQIVKTSLLG